MKQNKLLVAALLLSLVSGCSDNSAQLEISAAKIDADKKTAQLKTSAENVLLAEWQGSYQGVPAFDKIKVENFKPAIEEGMKQQLAEIDAIANSEEPATFENTIVAMERAGSTLDRVFNIYWVWSSNMSSPEFREVQSEMAPKIAAFFSKINQNEKLFERVKTVYESEEAKSLSPAQQRLAYLSYNAFAKNGATLEGEKKKRYAEINQRLAELHTKFSNNVLADEEGYAIYLNKEQLGGLPESLVAAAAVAAKERGQEGKYAITNTRSSMDPFLTYSSERDLRKKVWETYYNRGDNGDEHDNNEIIAEILKLRNERVNLLGYKNYASWRLEDRMAKTPENAIKLMEAVWPAAIARVDEEVADMQAVASKEGKMHSIEGWDYRYYAEKVRQQKYALDSDEVKQYFQLDKLVDSLFYVAGRLFDYEFTPVKEGSVPVFHADVKVWEVNNKVTGENIGLFYFDPYARKGKRSGAWMTTYRAHSTFDGKVTVLASNNLNFIKGNPGEPTLISWDDAETLFHEFGHGLHYLSSSVEYPSLNGALRDFVETQSQLLERWLATDEVINNYLVHYKTGEPIPAELVAKIKRSMTFNEGFKTTEYLASALVDMKLHTMDPTDLDVDKFEREALAGLNMPKELVMRHRTPHFAHIFSGEGYSAGYYSYMWADVITADAAEAFAEAPGGFYDKQVANKVLKHIFSIGNSIDPAVTYRNFRGRDANVNALMKDRGFPVTE